jgi:hypothetical protein
LNVRDLANASDDAGKHAGASSRNFRNAGGASNVTHALNKRQRRTWGRVMAVVLCSRGKNKIG